MQPRLQRTGQGPLQHAVQPYFIPQRAIQPHAELLLPKLWQLAAGVQRKLQWPLFIQLQAAIQCGLIGVVDQRQVANNQLIAAGAGRKLQLTQQSLTIKQQFANFQLPDTHCNRQIYIGQLHIGSRLVGLIHTVGQLQRDPFDLQLFKAQHTAPQAGSIQLHQRLLQHNPCFIAFPLQAIRLPSAQQRALITLQAQPGHPFQHPATAGVAQQQANSGQRHQHQQSQQRQQHP